MTASSFKLRASAPESRKAISYQPLYRKIAISAAVIMGARVFEGLLQFAVLAYIFWQTDKANYAAALLVVSIQWTVDLARGGLQKATVKFIAEFKSKQDHQMANSILSSSVALQGGVGLMGLMACFFVAPHASTIFALPAEMQQEVYWATLIMGLSIALTFLLSPWQNALAAQERYDLVSLVKVSSRITRAVLIGVLLPIDLSPIIAIVAATGIGSVVEVTACLLFNRKIDRGLRFSASNVGKAGLKTIFSFSFFDFFHTASGFLYTQGSLYLATHLVSLEAVAYLGVISNIKMILSLVMQDAAQTLVPVVSRLQAEGDHETIRKIVIRGTKVTVFVGGIAMSGILPWMESRLTVWLGPTFAQIAVPATVLLCSSYLLESLVCIHNPLGGIGKVAVDGITRLPCTVAGLGIGATLARTMDNGLLGLAIGMLSAHLFRFIFMFFYATGVFKIPRFGFLWQGYFKSYLAMVGVVASGVMTGLAWHGWPGLIAAGATTAAIYFAVGFFWIVEKQEREQALQLMKKAVSFLARRKWQQESR
jgi:O-antigen/teichoic acid export membrane protein